MDELHYQVDLVTAMNHRLANSEKMYRLICDTSNSAFLYFNFEDEHIEIAGNWSKYFGFTIDNKRDIVRIFDAVKEEDIIPLRDVLFLEKKGLTAATKDCALRDRPIYIECETTVYYNDFKQPTEKIIRFRDITKFKTQNEELTYMAYYDSLTGLYNRNYFVRVLGEWVRKAEEEKSVVSVLFVDVDDFRKINDGMGLIVGDEVVQVFGQYIGEFKSDKVIVSHFNSDIYCMAIYDPCGIRSVEHIYKALKERLSKPFLLTGRTEVPVSVSVGVAEYPESAKTSLELINCAEIVMFKAKATGKGNIQYFDGAILEEFLHNVEIENRLKDAIFNKKFELYFQPQYHTKTKALRGVEALIRWREDDGRMISPVDFIPIAEKNGAIIPIGDWVVEEGIRIYSEWKRRYGYCMILSLNISAIQYKRADFVNKLIDLIKINEVNPNDIELEITESILIDDFEEVIGKMKALREYGLKVSLDDFGTGFSSLSYLRGLPVDTLKIDKSFIDNVITDEASRVITESIIQMVKRLGFETVAEGVETQEQFDYLKSIDCDIIQGFLLGRPMEAYKIEELLKKQL
ncbi:MAG: bifunctional diguanylate cyclase/phosphodiesterase [Eubacteriales bacterium]